MVPSGPASAPGSDRAGRGRYAEAAELVGRPAVEFVYWIALAVTACADVALFNQILSIVLKLLRPWQIWLAVAGFTACALTLAHFAGRLARDRVAGYGHHGRTVVWLLVVAWLLVGLAAFTARLLVAEQTARGTAVGGLDATTANQASAGLFLVLYLASGAVAGVGAYLSRNPYRTRYRMAERNHRRALRRLARSQPPYERAVSVLQLHLRGRRREEDNHAAACRLRMAYAEEMKRYAAVLIAAHLQDPSATTGMTLPDRRPLSAADPAARADSAARPEADAGPAAPARPDETR